MNLCIDSDPDPPIPFFFLHITQNWDFKIGISKLRFQNFTTEMRQNPRSEPAAGAHSPEKLNKESD